VVKSGPVPDPASVETIRAAVDTLLPSVESRAGGADLNVERHVVEELEGFMEGFTDFLAALINAYAASVRPAATFVDLSSDERNAVIREMSAEESQDMREAIDAVILFSVGGMYSEWSAYDRETGALAPLAVWEDTGYHGPSRGQIDYRS
jgi:hypothetical protein